MSFRYRLIVGCVVVGGFLGVSYSPTRLVADETPAIDFQKEIAPFLNDYCAACHNPDDKIAELNVLKFESAESVTTQREVWEKIVNVLTKGEMPPEGELQPSDEEKAKILKWIKHELDNFDCAKIDNPGRVTIRRLNRTEYNNTIRDLLGVDLKPADDFPSDDVGYGFDNIGDVLSISPILMEKYLAAAEQVVEAAVWAEDPYLAPLQEFPPSKLLQNGGGGGSRGDDFALSSNGEVYVEYEIPADGDYLFIAEAYGHQAGPDPAKMELRLDGETVHKINVTAVEDAPGAYEHRATLKAGKHRLAAAFTNDYYQPEHEDPELRGDRNLLVRSLSIQGPIETKPAELPETHKRIVFCELSEGEDPLKCATAVLEKFISRAFRRPATENEVKKYLKLGYQVIENGGTPEQSLRVVLEAVLVSPKFLFRIELDDTSKKAEKYRELNEYELASRLSYWLWSSMPDDELFETARKGELSKPLVLEQQIERMLADPKSSALVQNFAGQWLQLRSLSESAPNKDVFPDFDEDLRAAMRRETELFFEAAIRDNISMLDFLDAKFTYVNERLAKHYGFPDVAGPEFRRVSLEGTNRAGVLTHASILTITSDPTRTAPVKRGKWILENILASPPPPPPPDVEALPEDEASVASGSLRQRLEIHRANPTCASCHDKMDPLGFGFENFDAIGRWRTKDAGFDINPAGTLPDGQTFETPGELLTVLKANRAAFCRCLTEKMLTYALGRGLEYYDKCAVDSITEAMSQNDYKMKTLFMEIAKSDPFRKRMNTRKKKK